MTEAKALGRYLRISPRKMRLVINTIRRKPADRALLELSFIHRKAARMAHKVLKSAIANAKVLKMDAGRLVVSDVRADGGPVLKRFFSRSMGRADRMLKRTTHLTVILREELKNPAASSPEKISNKDTQIKTKPSTLRAGKVRTVGKKMAKAK